MSTRLQRVEALGDANDEKRALESALASFAAGEIVGLPTECAYAFALAIESDVARATERELSAAGFRAEATALASPELALAELPVVTPAAARLVHRYLPGPLVVVAAGSALSRRVAVRVPGAAITRSFLAAVRSKALFFEPWSLDATTPDLRDAVTASALIERFPRFAGVVVDTGPARIGEAPAIVRADRSTFEVIRPGLLSEHDLRRAAVRRILFVCAGNTCRSPMAAALLRAALAERLDVTPESLPDVGFVVDSAGAYAAPGMPASRGARHAVAARGLDLSPHRSKPLSSELLAAQDRVYGMTDSIVEDLRSLVPRTQFVRHIDPGGEDVSDPFGGDDSVYIAAASEIATHIERIADEITRDGEAEAPSSRRRS